MTEDILVCENRPVTTLSGDQIPALEDGAVPLCDADGSQIGTVQIRGSMLSVDLERGGSGSATVMIGGMQAIVAVGPSHVNAPLVSVGPLMTPAEAEDVYAWLRERDDG